MSSEENKTLVRRLIEAINERDLATFDEIATAELAQHIKERAIPWLYGAFGDHRGEITDMIAEGDKVWARLATKGVHIGEWMGIPATGKQWTNTGIYFLHIVDGRIAELSSLFDTINHLQQLGATIIPPKQ